MDSASSVRGQFEAMLFEPLLEPMESAFGEYGSLIAAPFEAALAKAFER